MTVVFIGGSRSVTRLAPAVRERLDRIIEKKLPVVVGDANGADKAVQRYLADHAYEGVTVFATNGVCRNNLAGWPVRAVPAPKGARGFDFYAAKDEAMAKECTVGLMLWDGRSRGTLANAERLLDKNKKAVVYLVPAGRFVTLRDRNDLEQFLAHPAKGMQSSREDQAGLRLAGLP